MPNAAIRSATTRFDMIADSRFARDTGIRARRHGRHGRQLSQIARSTSMVDEIGMHGAGARRGRHLDQHLAGARVRSARPSRRRSASRAFPIEGAGSPRDLRWRRATDHDPRARSSRSEPSVKPDAPKYQNFALLLAVIPGMRHLHRQGRHDRSEPMEKHGEQGVPPAPPLFGGPPGKARASWPAKARRKRSRTATSTARR